MRGWQEGPGPALPTPATAQKLAGRGDGRTDGRPERLRLCVRFPGWMRPLSTQTAKEAQREGGEGSTDGHPHAGAGTEARVSPAPQNDPGCGV